MSKTELAIRVLTLLLFLGLLFVWHMELGACFLVIGFVLGEIAGMEGER